MRFLKFFFVTAWLLFPSVTAAEYVTLNWDPSPDPTVAGYIVYYGIGMGAYSWYLDAGLGTSLQVGGLDGETTYYFAVSAYSVTGIESSLSNEVRIRPSKTATKPPPNPTPPDDHPGSGANGSPVITALAASTPFPVSVGTPVTWLAEATADAPLEYQFMLCSGRPCTWAIARPYGADNSFTWVPGTSEIGRHTIQVWVRRVGWPEPVEVWRTVSGVTVDIVPLRVQLASDATFPAAPGTEVTWDATASAADAEFKFLQHRNSGDWIVLRDYRQNSSYTWIATKPGTYRIAVWSRKKGSAARWQARDEIVFDVTTTRASMRRVTTTNRFPVSVGSRVVWQAEASGGEARLEYEFRLWSKSRGWEVAQEYSTANRFHWVPGWNDVGIRMLQAYVRSTGSTEPYEDFETTAPFRVDGRRLQLQTATLFPAPPGRTIRWRATASAASALEYRFRLFRASSGWSVVRDYSRDPVWAWRAPRGSEDAYTVEVTARAPGSRLQMRVRSQKFRIAASPPKIEGIDLLGRIPVPGRHVTWVVTTSGGKIPVLLYRFEVLDQDGKRVAAQPYRVSNRFTWRALPGKYRLQVSVKHRGDVHSQAVKSMLFRVHP